MKPLHLLSVILCLAAAPGIVCGTASGQAAPTASRTADLQVGGGFTWVHTDYIPNDIGGYAFYADYDLLGHYGLEADFHREKDVHADALIPSNRFSETTYEIGGRYLRHYDRGRLAPYGKILYGRGVVNFPAHELVVPSGIELYIDNIAYNIATLGGGVDYRLMNRINVRGDFEYQHYFAHDNELPNGLRPYLLTVGVAYHFPAKGPFKLAP